jgi:dTDP-4-amino-4,6-dideoxygalactose transaminase
VNVPLLDLKAQYQAIRDEIDPVVAEVFETQYFILGPKVTECEQAVADYSGCPTAVGVSSGSDALLISLMAEDIGPGDEVITVPYTFFATVGAIARLGARPVFVDVDPVTYNMDPGKIEAAITPKTRAIIPVHLYGQMADMDPIMDIANRHNLVVIEDGAQAIGAEYKGHRAGSIGHYGCFSFFPSKNLGGAGDGGMVTFNDEERAERVRMLRNHGMQPKYYHHLVGGNFRLDALQAAVLTVKLRHLDDWTAGRQANARRYDRLFAESGLTEGTVKLPVHPHGEGADPQGMRHIFNQYIIRVPKRDELRTWLQEHSVGHEVYYPVALHQQECFADLGYEDEAFPVSEQAASETLALPIYPELNDEQAAYVVDAIRDFYQQD